MINQTKILIVEDEFIISDYIKNILLKENYHTIEISKTIEDAKIKMNQILPDILLLDINIEGPDSGIELAKFKNENAKIIFVTAQNDSATIQKAILVNPETYLTKPVKKADLITAVKLAEFKLAKKSITIKDGFKNIKLDFDSIKYIKSDNIYIDIFTIDRKYTLRQTLESFSQELDSNLFVKIHRSYIVNKKFITRTSTKFIYLDGIELPLSRNVKIEI